MIGSVGTPADDDISLIPGSFTGILVQGFPPGHHILQPVGKTLGLAARHITSHILCRVYDLVRIIISIRLKILFLGNPRTDPFTGMQHLIRKCFGVFILIGMGAVKNLAP